MIRLNVFFQVKEGAREEFLEVTKALVAGSLTEAGCVAYDIFASATRPDVFMMCETWVDAKALELHNQTPHYLVAHPRIVELCESKLEKFDM